jgi:hypothetical protein
VLERPGTPSQKQSCEAIERGGQGDGCDGWTLRCQTGLYCSPSGGCEAAASAGQGCGHCAPPFVCNKAGVCAIGQIGDACEGRWDRECAPGLACSPPPPGAGATWSCQSTTWAGSGGPCSSIARCLVGDCWFGFSGDPQAFDGGLEWSICPSVIGDGEPCPGAPEFFDTCDTSAECFEGSCVVGSTATCR